MRLTRHEPLRRIQHAHARTSWRHVHSGRIVRRHISSPTQLPANSDGERHVGDKLGRQALRSRQTQMTIAVLPTSSDQIAAVSSELVSIWGGASEDGRHFEEGALEGRWLVRATSEMVAGLRGRRPRWSATGDAAPEVVGSWRGQHMGWSASRTLGDDGLQGAPPARCPGQAEGRGVSGRGAC